MSLRLRSIDATFSLTLTSFLAQQVHRRSGIDMALSSQYLTEATGYFAS